MQLIGAATPDVPNQTPMPQPSKQLLNACPVPPMDIVVTLLAGCQSAILSSNEWHNDMNPAFISAIMALEAGIFKPLIASSSSRGMKARGRDLQVPVSANWTQTTGTTQQNTTQHNAKKKERKPLFASFSSRGKARGRDLQAPDCLLLEPGYESSRQGSSSAGIGELDTNNNTSNKAWIQRLFRFPQ